MDRAGGSVAGLDLSRANPGHVNLHGGVVTVVVPNGADNWLCPRGLHVSARLDHTEKIGGQHHVFARRVIHRFPECRLAGRIVRYFVARLV